MTWYIILFYAFALLGGLLGVLFFIKKEGDRLANSLLGIFTLLFACELAYNSAKWSGFLIQPEGIHFIFLNFPVWLLYGPLLLLYLKRVESQKFTIQDFIRFIPALLVFATNLPFHLLDAKTKLSTLQNGLFYSYSWLPDWNIYPIMLFMFGFGWVAFANHGPWSKTRHNRSVWSAWFICAYLGFCAAFAFYVLGVQFGFVNPLYDYYVDIVIVGFIGVLTYFGFIQPEVFQGMRVEQLIPFVKYQKTGLSTALGLEMKDKLEQLMLEKELYLENDLRMDDLAKALNLSRNHTSQIINQYFNRSFFDFVNEYRIEEAKRLLMNRTDKRTMTQIAYDSGFNNRASFYKAFKKFEGKNPSEYISLKKVS